jgi:hypothetical protein
MTVETILATKGTDVATIEPTATLEYAIGILAERRIGALVVLGADHRVIGLLSERDIVRALAERGACVLTEPLATAHQQLSNIERTNSTWTPEQRRGAMNDAPLPHELGAFWRPRHANQPIAVSFSTRAKMMTSIPAGTDRQDAVR